MYKNNTSLFVDNPTPPATPPKFQGKKGVVVAPQKCNLEMLMENFVMTQTHQYKDYKNQNLHTNDVLRKLASKVDIMATHNKKN